MTSTQATKTYRIKRGPQGDFLAADGTFTTDRTAALAFSTLPEAMATAAEQRAKSFDRLAITTGW